MKNPQKHFDIFKKRKLVFFDNSASTLKPKVVCDAVDFYNRFEAANSGRGVSRLSFEVTSKVERAREALANFLKAEDRDVVFVKNTTDGINLVARSFARNILEKDDEILISPLEHNSNYLPWLNLAKEKQANLKFVSLDENRRITFENFKKAFTTKTKFVAFTIVSNTMGHILPAKEIVEFCKKNNVKILLDASQAVAHIALSLKEIDCDFCVFSAYKMFGPTGVGALILKKEIAKQMQPVQFGGGMVLEVCENEIVFKNSPAKFEAGTLPIASIIGFGEAVAFIEDIGFEKIEKVERELKEYFVQEVSKIDGLTLYNPDADVPIFLFNLQNVHAHDAASMFDEFNVVVRAGNHCALLMGDYLQEIATVRASLSFYNTMEDVDKLVLACKQILKFYN